MEIYNTKEKTAQVPIFMLLYGEGGIGKSTFAATAPGVFMADCEGGAKFFGRRGINVVVASIQTWFDFAGKDQFVDMALANPKVQTIVVDPMDELLEKCKRGLSGSGLTTGDGQPTLRGWGEIANRMSTQLRRLRDAGKNVILIAHVDEKEDDGRLVKRPLIQTKLSKKLINMVDLVGYMYGRLNEDNKVERVISFDPSDDKIEAKDRTGALDPIMPPLFTALRDRIDTYEVPTKEEDEGTEPSFPESTSGERSVEGSDEKETGDTLGNESTQDDQELVRQEKLAEAKAKLKGVK